MKTKAGRGSASSLAKKTEPEPTELSSYFPATQFFELGVRHGISWEFNLPGKILRSWSWWRAHGQRHNVEGDVADRKCFDEVVKRIDALIESMRVVSPYQRGVLINISRVEPYTIFYDVLKDLSVLREAVDKTLAALPKPKRGRRSVEARVELIAHLYSVYTDAFGERPVPRISKNLGEYGGPFFEFAKEVLYLYRDRPTRSALGRAIERAQAIVDADHAANQSLNKGSTSAQ